MTIDDYIQKNGIKDFDESFAIPESLPPQAYAYGAEILIPTFAGSNDAGTIFVTTYKENRFFVVYEKNKKRIIGKLTENSKDLK